MSRAWLMLAAGETRQHGGNDGYDDEPSKCYHWNSTVPNHALPVRGDVIAIWNKLELIGVSVIDDIHTDDDVPFDHNECPHCGRSSIKRRKVKTPGWLCFACHREFDTPRIKTLSVRDYHTVHESAWVDMAGFLDAAELRQLCREPKSQHSIRELDWQLFTHNGDIEHLASLNVVEKRVKQLAGGFKTTVVRARIGQTSFRTALMNKFGSSCAITGPQPRSTLDAAHLYSYAEHGSHDEHGGLLLRKDIHRLFDLGLLCINGDSLAVDVHAELRRFPTYASHHKQALSIKLPTETRNWLKMHWALHRG